MKEDVKLNIFGKDGKVVRNNKNNGEPLIQSHELDDIYIRSMYFDKTGEFNTPHEHNFDHYTFLTTGSCRAELDGEVSIHIAPCIIFTPANMLHKFIALEPDTSLHCINVLHDGMPIIKETL